MKFAAVFNGWKALFVAAVVLLFCSCSTSRPQTDSTAQARASQSPSVIYVPVFILSPHDGPPDSNSVPNSIPPETTIRFEQPALPSAAPNRQPLAL